MRQKHLAAAVLLACTLPPAVQAASITATAADTVIRVGEQTTIDLFLTLDAGEVASVLEGRFGLDGLGSVADVTLAPGGPTWTSVAGNISGGDAIVSLTSNNTGGNRLIAELTVTGLANGTFNVLYTDALAAFDIPAPPFLDTLALTNMAGDTLASVAVVPVPPAFVLMLSGLGLAALRRRRTARDLALTA